MALLLIEGFEGATSKGGGVAYNMSTMLQSKGYYCWDEIWSDDGRVSGVSFKDHTNRGFVIPFSTTDDTIIIGFGFKASDWPGTGVAHSIIRIRDIAGNTHASLQMYDTCDFRVVVPEGTYTTVNSPGGSGAWYYIEFKIVIGETGSFELKVDTLTELSDDTIDTRANTDGSACFLDFVSTALWRWFDDIYFCDSTGAKNNDFLGICQVVGKFPDADGSSSDFTPSAGDNYATVDDADTDSDTTYNEGVSGDIDYYEYADLSEEGIVIGIQINTTVRTTDAEAMAIQSKVNSNASIDTGTARGVNTDYTMEYEIVVDDPDTATAWTIAGINSAEFGLEVE